MAVTIELPTSPAGSTLEKNEVSKIESAPVYPGLSLEDSRWLDEFPEDRKKRAVRKVRET